MIVGLVELAVLYLLLLTGGARLTARLPLAGRMERWLMTLAFASAQLLSAVQILSLAERLTGFDLIGLNAVLTGLLFVATRRWRPVTQVQDPPLVRQALVVVGAHPVAVLALGVAVASVTAAAGIGAWAYPMNDIYHYAMPLFWKQHASILPFPAYDPRLIGVTFGSEALCFPVVLYLNSGAGGAWLSAFAGLTAIWITAALARQLGASKAAAAMAGALVAGMLPVTRALVTAGADLLLSGVWFAASAYFLVASRETEESERARVMLGCSVFCLVLAAATKNTVLLQVPAWLAVAVGWHSRRFFRRPFLWTTARWAVVAVVTSGLLWNYVGNFVWFGTVKGDHQLRRTVSTELGFGAIWTRIVRGAVVTVLDTIWVPPRFAAGYAQATVEAVRLLGGRGQLADDEGFYSFTDDGPRPGRGLGPLGAVLLLPAIVVGLAGGGRRRREGPTLPCRRSAATGLAWLTVGSFLAYHIVLRWQAPGLARLMIPCALAGLPLTALLLEKTAVRMAAMAMLVVVVGIYETLLLGVVVNHVGAPAGSSRLAAWLGSIQPGRVWRLKYRWQDGSSGVLDVRDLSTRREFFELVFRQLQRPAVIGLVGSFNMAGYFAFGPTWANEVVSLVDSRVPDRHVSPPASVEFIFAELIEFKGLDETLLEGFERWLEVTTDEEPVFLVYRRRSAVS